MLLYHRRAYVVGIVVAVTIRLIILREEGGGSKPKTTKNDVLTKTT